MDIPSSMAVGGVRIALQVATASKRPALEIYHYLRNVSAPPINIPIQDHSGKEIGSQEHRFTDAFFDFQLVNIGGLRAEDVHVKFVGEDEYFPGEAVPLVVQEQPISKFPPGQVLLLFRLPSDYVTSRSRPFLLRVRFNGPDEGINRIVRAWSKFRKRSQYEYLFHFDPGQYSGAHLPSPEYNG